MDRWIASNHPHLAEVNVGLQWARGWKPDKDAKLTLGRAGKASEIERQTLGVHAWIKINSMFWNSPTTTDAHRDALMDHELCHIKVELDKNGDPRKDDRGMICIRMARHDCEEFEAIIERHGLHTVTLQRVAAVLYNNQNNVSQASAPTPRLNTSPSTSVSSTEPDDIVDALETVPSV